MPPKANNLILRPRANPPPPFLHRFQGGGGLACQLSTKTSSSLKHHSTCPHVLMQLLSPISPSREREYDILYEFGGF